MNVTINGDFLCRNLTGIERFAYETCSRLDEISKKDEITVYVPCNIKTNPEWQNIKIIHSNKSCSFFPKWEHLDFSLFCKKTKTIPLDFANVTPWFNPGIVFVHDIYAKLYPQDFSGKKDKLIRLYMCMMYHHVAKKAKKIITVSNFSKKQLLENYKIKNKDIDVIYNGWEHFSKIHASDEIFKRFPTLKEKEFYFTLGSLQKRKNLKWIAEYAQKHKNQIFAVSGKAISGMVSDDIKILQTLQNVVLLGYVSDEEVKALMQKCKAFLFPSYYEGFGIPPLEALSEGAQIIISKSASLPELYMDCAHYIDSNSTDINLDDLLKQKVPPCQKLLEKYSYKKAAEDLLKIIRSF